MFVAAGPCSWLPVRCASGPGDPQSLSLDYVPLSTCPALGAGDPQSPSLDCVPLSTCPALEASAGRSHRQRRPGRIAGGGGVCLRWGMNSFGAVCEWGCEGSERPGLRSGSGNSESEAGSGPASPAIAGGPQPSAAKARNSLQSLPPFAGCAREPPLPSASRDPAPSTCLPSNGPVHFPPENRFAHLLPEHRPCLPLDLLPPENRFADPPPETRFADPPPENRPGHPSPETPRRPPASRATAPFISLPRTASHISCPSTVPACRSISCLPRTAPARPPHRFFPRIMETDPRLRALSLRCPAPPCVALFPENKAWGGRCRQQHGGSSDETIAVGIPGRPHRVCGARPGFSRNPRLGSLRSPLSRTGRRPRRPRPR